MDRVVYEELDEARAEIEKLKVEYRIKAELSQNLKKAHNEQLIKIQESSLKIEKQARELNEKAEEISATKQMYEDLKCSFNEKESIIKRLSSANDKLRVDCDEKSRRREEENRELALALDKANEKSVDQEQKIRAFKEEIEGLKGVLSVSQRKCLEAEKKAKASNELRQRDDMLLKLEEENGKVEDQLKWKKEQFKHLEEAHEKLRDQFRTSKKEWELEISTLLDEIRSLQTRLDSQTRISEDLQSRLLQCNQALAHEESRRKYLEVQLSESKTCFENAFSECREAKSKIECVTLHRDKEIADLRNSLGRKETIFKEMDYQSAKLELENQELRLSLKELQEAWIVEARTTSSLAKLRNKLRSLEKMHRDCSENLKTKEAEWVSQLEKMAGDLNDYWSKLESKDTAIKELKMVQNEEISLMLLVLKSGYAEAQLKHDKEREENVSLLMKQLETKNRALVKAQTDIEEECEKAASLLRRVESFDLIEQQKILMQKEIEKALQMEDDFKERMREVCDALDRANSELDEKTCEGSEIEFELQIWKSNAERLKVDLEENHELRREIEASLLEQAEFEETLKQEKDGLILLLEEKERRIENLQQQIVLLDRELNKRETETASFAFESEKEDSFLRTAKEKDKILEDLQKEIEWLEQESVRRELEGAMFAQIVAERTFEHEKENLIQLVHEKDRRIDDLLQLSKSLEQNFNSSLISLSSQLEEKQAEINLVHEAWEKITTAEILANLEIEEKKLMIVELEDDILNIQQKLEYQEKTFSQSKQQALEIEADLEAKQLEMKKLTCLLETKMRTSDALIKELKSEKRNLLEDVMKLSSERENLLGFIGGLCDRISKVSSEDMQLMGILGRIVQTFDNNELGKDSKGDDEFESMKENVNTQLSPTMKKFEAIPDDRSPFRELNS